MLCGWIESIAVSFVHVLHGSIYFVNVPIPNIKPPWNGGVLNPTFLIMGHRKKKASKVKIRLK